MYKNINDACCHAKLCYGCNRWGCADDQLLFCEDCYDGCDSTICEECLVVSRFTNTLADLNQYEHFCKPIWKKRKHKDTPYSDQLTLCVECVTCEKSCGRTRKKIYKDNEFIGYECLSCVVKEINAQKQIDAISFYFE
jgi:hypothetical protein